jgi:hypothetical protein
MGSGEPNVTQSQHGLMGVAVNPPPKIDLKEAALQELFSSFTTWERWRT